MRSSYRNDGLSPLVTERPGAVEPSGKKVEASIGGGPWGRWYEVRSEGDLVIWSTVEGDDERQEVVEPGRGSGALSKMPEPRAGRVLG